MPAHAQLRAMIGAGRYAHLDRALEGGGDDGRPQHGLPRREIDLVIKIGTPRSKVRMPGIAHAQIEIARGRSPNPGFAFARDPDPPPLHRARRNADLKGTGFGLARARVESLKRNRPHRPVHHFGERDEDLTLDIRARSSLRADLRVEVAPDGFKTEPAAPAEELFEESR